MTTQIKWTKELLDVVIQYKTVVEQSYPDVPALQYRQYEKTPNALLLGLMALVQDKLREGQVVSAIAVYHRYYKVHGRDKKPVEQANKRSRDEEPVVPANKRSRDEERVPAAPEPAVEPAQQQEPAASTCNEYPKSGTAVSTNDRMLLRTWARNNLTDLAGKGSMSPAFMELVRAMQRPPNGISYMVAEYRRNNSLAAPESPAASETRATTGGKRLTRARSKSPVPSYGSSRSSSSSSEDERPTTGGKGPRFVEENRQAMAVSSTCTLSSTPRWRGWRDVAPRLIADWNDSDYAVLRQWKIDHPDYQQSRRRHSAEFSALATSLGRTPRATWDRCYGAKHILAGHKRKMTQPQRVQKPAEDKAGAVSSTRDYANAGLPWIDKDIALVLEWNFEHSSDQSGPDFYSEAFLKLARTLQRSNGATADMLASLRQSEVLEAPPQQVAPETHVYSTRDVAPR